jgi:hypothetical protein
VRQLPFGEGDQTTVSARGIPDTEGHGGGCMRHVRTSQGANVAGGYVYVFSLINLHTRYTWCYLLANKEGSTVLAVLRKWHKQVEQEKGIRLQCLRSDRGKEFVNNAITSWLQEQGIKQ